MSEHDVLFGYRPLGRGARRWRSRECVRRVRSRTTRASRAAPGTEPYVRLKISGVVDRYAETACAVCDFPPDSTQPLLARSALRCWAERENLFDQRVEPSSRQLDFLVAFDLAYGARRLRFVIDGLNHWYPCAGTSHYPQREQIDAARADLWAAVGTCATPCREPGSTRS